MPPSQTAKKRFRCFGLREHLSLLVAIPLLLAGLSLAWVGYRLAARTALEAVNIQAERIAGTVLRETLHEVQPLQPVLSALARGPLSGHNSLEERIALLPVLWTLLNRNPVLEALWIGYESGDFLLVDHLTSEEERQAFKAPPGSAVLVWHISRGPGREDRNEELFFDDSLNLLDHRNVADRGYDPRQRVWYKQAMLSDRQIGAPPSNIAGLQITGTVFAEKSADGRAVLGGGLNQERLAAVLRRELPSPNAQLAILRPDGSLIATAQGPGVTTSQRARGQTAEPSPIIGLGIEAYQEGRRGLKTETTPDGRVWILSLDNFDLADQVQEVMLVAMPRDEILAPAFTFIRQTMMVMAGLLLFWLPLAWLAARRLSRPLCALARDMRHMPAHYLDQSPHLDSPVREIQALAHGLTAVQEDVQKLLRLLGAISAEPDFPQLLKTMTKETTILAEADGGLIALWDEKAEHLNEGRAFWWGEWVEVEPGLRADNRLPNPSLPTNQAMRRNKIIVTTVSRQDRRGLAGYLDPGFRDPETKWVEVVCVPLSGRRGEKLGVLALFKALKEEAASFRAQQVFFIQSLASAVAVALENQRLIRTRTKPAPPPEGQGS